MMPTNAGAARILCLVERACILPVKAFVKFGLNHSKFAMKERDRCIWGVMVSCFHVVKLDNTQVK